MKLGVSANFMQCDPDHFYVEVNIWAIFLKTSFLYISVVVQQTIHHSEAFCKQDWNFVIDRKLLTRP